MNKVVEAQLYIGSTVSLPPVSSKPYQILSPSSCSWG